MRKPSPGPIVAFSKVDDFNETMSLDLHHLQPGLWCMHMIDEFTKFSAAAIIASKSHCENIFINDWITIFGAPKKIFSDNVREFTGDNFHEMCERFNIKIQTAPAFSSWSNSVCERNNQTLTTILLKIKDCVKCIIK